MSQNYGADLRACGREGHAGDAEGGVWKYWGVVCDGVGVDIF